MVVINSYAVAVALCFLGMLAWGSWPNTLKLVKKEWKFQLFYWDYAVGVLLFALIVALTLGSNGSAGRSFVDDLRQATPAAWDWRSSAASSLIVITCCWSAAWTSPASPWRFRSASDMASALGTMVNYVSEPKGDPLLVFGGVAAIVSAVRSCAGVQADAFARTENFDQGNSSLLAAGIFGAFFFLHRDGIHGRNRS